MKKLEQDEKNVETTEQAVAEKSATVEPKTEQVADTTAEQVVVDTANQQVATETQQPAQTVESTAEQVATETQQPAEIEEQDNSPEAEYERLRATAKWYVLHTFSSYENVAQQNLEIVVEKYNLEKRVFDIVIPMEDVMEEKNGKRKIVSRKVMPGYIMVKMIYGDDIWHAITRTRGITGFVGPKGRPLPLTTDEIRKMKLEKIAVVNIDLAVGDKVEVLEGALYGFVGQITSLDIEGNKCRVMVEMFGRETPVDLTLDQIRKLS